MLKNVFGDPVWPKLQKLFNENPSKINPRVKLPRIDALFGHNSVNFEHREPPKYIFELVIPLPISQSTKIFNLRTFEN